MTDIRASLTDIFAQNRAEEIGNDVWRYFVIPPFYDRLDLQTARKPRIIVGGRGCGKTMLLRYLSHTSTFSRYRESVPPTALNHIGLYWRADTQFCNAMVKRGIPEDTWRAAFNHLAALTLGVELLDSLNSISNSKLTIISNADVKGIDFSDLRYFDNSIPTSFDDLYKALKGRLCGLQTWITDVRKAKEPHFLPGREVVLSLIEIIKKNVHAFNNAIYYVYLDEYENLTAEQQRIINTWLKHSEAPLIFNIAMKRNTSFEDRRTLGDESLADIHDYRQHDIEEYLSEDFRTFAAEIILLHLLLVGYTDVPVDENTLRNPSDIQKRRDKLYGEKVLSAAQSILPDVSQEDLAGLVFRDKALSAKLRDRISHALTARHSKVAATLLFQPQYPEASIVVPALLHRNRLKPEDVAVEVKYLLAGEPNKFTGDTGWIHNNFIGCLLQLYAPYDRACPFYAGFNTFCKLSKGNIRHFLELCHKSIYKSVDNWGNVKFPVKPVEQAEAARNASAAFLGEIRSFGRRGNQLRTFVLRLGSLFGLAHRRPSQSESEQTHFSIRNGTEQLSEEDYNFLAEAVKWSVLYEHIDTKKKAEYKPQAVEYILNPIYAPYFHISYRKKRKLELSTSDVICLMRGNLTEFTEFMKRFSKDWHIEPGEAAPVPRSLFEEADS